MSSSSSTTDVVVQTDLRAPEFDWSSARIRFPLSQGNSGAPEWSCVVCGDWAPRLGHQEAMIKDPLTFYGDLLPIMQDADLAMVNLEGVLTDDNLQPIVKDGIVKQFPTGTIAGLSAVPFHLACMANNHVFDLGAEGLTRTQKLLESHHIKSVGAGLSGQQAEQARVFQFGNIRLAVVNAAEGEEGRSASGGPGVAGLDLPRLQAQLSSLRTRADVLIVIIHAGCEDLPIPGPHIRSIYRSLVDGGAHLVAAHHPHVPQGIELYRGVPIAYSLGNFALWTRSPVGYHHVGYLLKAKFRGSEFNMLEIWPYRIQANGLRLLTGAQLRAFLLELEELSALIADDDRLAALWDAYADSWLVSRGMQEVADSIALLGGEGRLVQATLKKSLNRFDGGRIADRCARRAIWKAINWLSRRMRSEQLPTKSNRLAEMKRGASTLRNRFDTLAHRELYLTALRRAMEGKLGHAPEWARETLSDWEVFGTEDK